MQTIKYLYQKKVMTLAKQLLKAAFGTWSECLKEAHFAIKDVETHLIRFKKKGGEITTRIVAKWSEFNISKGTGRKKPEGLRLFADLGKVLINAAYNTISAYQDSILLFA